MILVGTGGSELLSSKNFPLWCCEKRQQATGYINRQVSRELCHFRKVKQQQQPTKAVNANEY